MNQFFKYLKLAFKFMSTNRKLVFFVYAIQLLFAIFISYPIHNLINHIAGSSSLYQQSINKFDYNFINDLLIQIRQGNDVAFDYTLILICVYIIFSIFISGGITKQLLGSDSKVEISKIFHSGSKYFWRLLRLFIYTALIFVCLLIIFWFLYKGSGMHVFEIASDETIINKVKFLFPLMIITILFGSFFLEFFKAYIIHQDLNPTLINVGSVIKIISKNLGLVITMVIFFTIIFLIASYLQTRIKFILEDTFILIVLVFVLIQILAVIKIFFRLLSQKMVADMIREY